MKSISTLNGIIKANHSIIVNLIEMDTQPYGGAVTTYRFCTGWYPLTWNGNNYVASGNIIEIDSHEETLDNRATGITFTISGVGPSERALALDAQYSYPGRSVRVYLAGLNADYTVAAADLRFAGFINTMTIQDKGGLSGGSTVVKIACENKLLRLRKAEGRRMSDEQQRKLHPSDTAFRHLVNMRERVLTFTSPQR